MARTKKTAAVITLSRDVLPNGMIRLTSVKGIIDMRSGAIYSEVVCTPKKEKFFVEQA